jgi:hypothetical protein
MGWCRGNHTCVGICGREMHRDLWSWLFLLDLFSAAMSQTALCLFSLSKGFFVGATRLVPQQQFFQS